MTSPRRETFLPSLSLRTDAACAKHLCKFQGLARLPVEMSGRVSKSRLQLSDLPSDFEWCTVSASNDIHLKPVHGSTQTGTHTTILSVPTRIALSLNQKCCERGVGRVRGHHRLDQRDD